MNISSLLSTLGLTSTTETSVAESVGLTLVKSVVGTNMLAGLNTAAQTAVKSVVTEAEDGIDQLRDAFNSWSASKPIVSKAIDLTTSLAEGQGLAIPDQDSVVTHVKAAIGEVAAIFGVTGASAAAAAPAAAATTTAAPAA